MFTFDTSRFPMRDLTAQAKISAVDGTGPASYVAGGEAVTLEDIGLSEVWYYIPAVATNVAGTSFWVTYDRTNNKLKWLDWAGADIAPGTDLSGFTYTIAFFGK